MIHHKDENTINDNPNNLELITKGEHNTIHMGKPVILTKGEEKLEFTTAASASKYFGLYRNAVSLYILRGLKVKGWIPQYK